MLLFYVVAIIRDTTHVVMCVSLWHSPEYYAYSPQANKEFRENTLGALKEHCEEFLDALKKSESTPLKTSLQEAKDKLGALEEEHDQLKREVSRSCSAV